MKVTLELDGEEERVYKKIMDNFNTQKYPMDEVNKRLFLRGMLEAADIMNKIVQTRDQPPLIQIVGRKPVQMDRIPEWNPDAGKFMGA